jgi:hypothetical protein
MKAVSRWSRSANAITKKVRNGLRNSSCFVDVEEVPPVVLTVKSARSTAVVTSAPVAKD